MDGQVAAQHRSRIVAFGEPLGHQGTKYEKAVEGVDVGFLVLTLLTTPDSLLLQRRLQWKNERY
ncbi:MAG TPA: hypothetical protein VLH40_01230 [Atribacteraceae bacterium]|nr:hypothetical protein [Atribacteraceae bacterium]